jgi:ABC-type multidrug transport system fused ATPase/permease subunit
VTSKSADRNYKRSWKNLLINKRYQLRFTLFMVGLSALLMFGLGIWVMWVANETTAVSMTSVRGDACPKLPPFGHVSPSGEDEPAIPPPSMKLDDADGAAAAAGAAAAPGAVPTPPGAVPTPPTPPAPPPAPPAGSAATAPHPPVSGPGPAAPGVPAGADDEPRRVKVQIDESSMTLTATLPPDLADRITAHWTCELRQIATFDRLERGRMRILWAMILTGLALVFGLALYGIKMTHRVAGPLFKVSLYLSKMREGRFDKVYNLRKGDQLVDFYDQFKHAHGGIVTMQRDDITRVAAVVAAAEAAGLGQHPAVAELRELCARKEKSIE